MSCSRTCRVEILLTFTTISYSTFTMIKLSMKFNLSLGKILLGFAGISIVVCTYKFYALKKNEEDTCDIDDYSSISEKLTCVTYKDVNPSDWFENSNEVSVKSIRVLISKLLKLVKQI